jgi:hypothetical protein
MLKQTELFREIKRYAQGTVSLDDFYDWVTDHLFEAMKSPQQPVSRQVSQIMLIFSEYQCGHRTEANVKQLLVEMLPVPETFARAKAASFWSAALSPSLASLTQTHWAIADIRSEVEVVQHASHSVEFRSNADQRFWEEVCTQ